MLNVNFAERIGLDFLRKWVDRSDPHIHKWARSELAQIRRIERWTITVAALTGAISGSLLGTSEIWLSGAMVEDADATHLREQLPYWSIYLSLAVLVSGAVILFLYWLVLRMVARISWIAGLRLSAEEIEEAIALGLSRAALELPNPREPIYGIDPYARVARWKLVAYAILYRLKIGLTSFVLRVLLRRVLARAALRFYVPLVSIPVFAIWNALIISWVMREVRIRVAGPVAVQDLAELISAHKANLSEQSRRLMLETVGEAIIRGEDHHPNYVLLLERLSQDLGIPPESIAVNWNSSRHSLQNENGKAQDILLVTLTIATMLNGQLRRAQRELLAEAYAVCGRSFDLHGLAELRREFISGRGVSKENLKAVLSVVLQ
jgi:hypothetical protein